MNKWANGQTKVLSIMKALLAAYMITAVMLLLLALILYKLEPSAMVISVGIIFSYLFSSFIGGLIMGKSTKQKKFLWGMLLGVLYFVIILTVSVIMNKSVFEQIGSMVMVFAMCTLGGMLGGMVS